MLNLKIALLLFPQSTPETRAIKFCDRMLLPIATNSVIPGSHIRNLQNMPIWYYATEIREVLSLHGFFFFIFISTPEGHERGTFCRIIISFQSGTENIDQSSLSTAHFITSACSFNIGLALLLGIRSLDPRPRARTAPALAWCRRQLGSQTSCSAKSRSQFWSLTFNDKH